MRGARSARRGGVRPGDAVAILAAKPVEVAPVAQAAWLAGGSVTMLHQPTARTNLATYADETAAVLGLIGAKVVVLGDPFTDSATMFDGVADRVVTAGELSATPVRVPRLRRRRRHRRRRPTARTIDGSARTCPRCCS